MMSGIQGSSVETLRQEAMDELMAADVRLRRLVDRGVEALATTPARAQVLVVLHRQGPRTSAELARLLEVTPRNVTALVDALQAQALVARTTHPSDRRATPVALTAAGSALARRMERGYARLGSRLLAGWPREDLAELRRLLGLVNVALEAEAG